MQNICLAFHGYLCPRLHTTQIFLHGAHKEVDDLSSQLHNSCWDCIKTFYLPLLLEMLHVVQKTLLPNLLPQTHTVTNNNHNNTVIIIATNSYCTNNIIAHLIYTNSYCTNNITAQLIATNAYCTNNITAEIIATNSYCTNNITAQLIATNSYHTNNITAILIATGSYCTNNIFYLGQNFTQSFFPLRFNNTTTHEINQIIHSLKCKDSYGYDEISTRNLKMSAPYI